MVSFLVHAAVIYLIPSVDLLPQPSSQYFEIETVTIEPEEQKVLPEDQQSPDRQTARQPEIPESAQEPVTPLSDYEPTMPDTFNGDQEQLDTQLLIPQQHFSLPETLENVNAVVSSPQKSAVHPAPADLELAILPARIFSKTATEASVHEAHPIQELTKDVIVVAEQPYEGSVAPAVSGVTQETLPDLKRSQRSEVTEQTNIPSFPTETVMKRTIDSDVSALAHPTLSNIHVSPERPSLRISETKALPPPLSAEQAHPPILSEIETRTETRVAAISTETEPEFRPAQSVLLLTSHSQDVVDVAEPVLKPVHPAAAAMQNLVLQPDTPPVYVKPEEKLPDTKAFPSMTDDQIVQRAEGLERPISPETESSETKPELQDNALPQIAQLVMAQAIGAPERIYSPGQLTKSPRKVEVFAEDIEPKVVDIRQSKSPIQEENPSQKILPSFQSFSSLPPLLIATQQTQQDRTALPDKEDVSEVIPRPDLLDAALFEENTQPSTPLVMAFPRTSQVLRPQNLIASTTFTPFVSSEKTMTTIEETMRVKKVAEDAQQPGLIMDRRSAPVERQAGEQEFEMLQQPQKVLSRPGSALPAIPAQSPALKPAQRSLIFGAETGSSGLSAKPGSFGMFVRKDAPVSEIKSPQKTIQLDDALQQIRTDASEQDHISLAIEGPASMRQVISKPLRLPEIDLDVEVTIRLKFWVLPDGSVGEVVPLQRGDIRLERAAIQYLKSWRFTPLSSGNQTVWGIIPITYKLR